ncbi:hypothetical protein LJC46_06845 [Desulfovibrio sp. OttesenSCG-928-G15]|nr:hypothetical protein [Desulfovibrio sp. OttesenSCG-928-G15]
MRWALPRLMPQAVAQMARTTALAIFCLALAACARTQMDKILPGMTSMVTARHYFGPPTTSETLPNGNIRHEWLLDREFMQAGGMETRLVYVGHDSDGYREYVEQEVYVRPYTEKQYCRLIITSDAAERVLASSWEGSHCDYLPKVKSSR